MLRNYLAPGFRSLRSVRARRFMHNAAGEVDALLASFPKSGRTWLRFVLASYFAEALELGAPPDLHSMFRVIPNFDADPTRGLPAFRFAQFRPELPLICVTHAPPGSTPRLPVIFLVRDPRDVVVSRYFHSTRHKNQFEGTIAQFVDDGDHGLPAYIRYLNAWAGFLRHVPHHVTSYERMSLGTAGEIHAILGFLGVEVNERALATAVSRAAFDSMRSQERVQGIPAHHYDRSDDESLRMRRGVPHGFAGYLGPDLVTHIDQRCARELSGEALELLRKYSLQSCDLAALGPTAQMPAVSTS
jgi:Sulfotransferase domain